MNGITRNDNFVGAVFEPINNGPREALAVALQGDVISQTSAHQLISSRHTGRNYSINRQTRNISTIKIRVECQSVFHFEILPVVRHLIDANDSHRSGII
jgi:hypothetical protein